MKPITPSEINAVEENTLVNDIVIRAYNQLIKERYNPKHSSSTFTQCVLMGRILNLGHHDISPASLIKNGSLNHQKQYEDVGWEVRPWSGFYITLDGSKSITFRIKI